MIGRALVGSGVGIEGLATVFISLDALKTQRKQAPIFGREAWVQGIDGGLQLQPSTDADYSKKVHGVNLGETIDILNSAQLEVTKDEKKKVGEAKSALSEHLLKTYPKVIIAIALAFIGVLIDLIGVIAFNG